MIKFSKWLKLREEAPAMPGKPSEFDVKLQQQIQKELPAGKVGESDPVKAVATATSKLVRNGDPNMATQAAKALTQNNKQMMMKKKQKKK